MNNIVKGLVIVLAGALLTACAHQANVAGTDAPGFSYGLLHGVISPFALIASIFTDVRVYAVPNSGGWYDFGFVIGCAVIYGGTGANAELRFTRSPSKDRSASPPQH